MATRGWRWWTASSSTPEATREAGAGRCEGRCGGDETRQLSANEDHHATGCPTTDDDDPRGPGIFQESSKPGGAKSAGNRFQNHKHTHILSPLPDQAHSTAVSLQNGVSPPAPVVWNTARELHATHTHHGNKADSFRRAAAANEPRDLRPPWQA